MSEVQVEEQNEEQPNPYNAKKPWHDVENNTSKQGANGLFYQESQATLDNEAPDEDAPKKGTNYKKRYDDLKKHYDQKLSEFRQREGELLAEAKSAQPSYQPPKTEEDLEAFKTEYPDLYNTVETVAHMQSQRQVADLEAQLDSLRQRETEVMRKEAETTLRDRHPDFDDIRGSDGFHEWAKIQPEQIQDWVYNNPDNVSLASKAIDLYKLETGTGQPQKRRSRPKAKPASAADMVSTKTTNVDPQQAKVWTEREIASMSLDQFDKYESEINQAWAEGRIVAN
tara:strand:+ start:2875 stop:3723 length:849 start_codon:yes stop_codon:yes gene_type:complete